MQQQNTMSLTEEHLNEPPHPLLGAFAPTAAGAGGGAGANTTIDLSTSDYIQSIINLARTFIFDGIREYVNIVFFIIDSIHDNFSSRVSGLSNVIHSIIKEIKELDKTSGTQTHPMFDWNAEYGVSSSSKDHTTQFYHYLMGKSKRINTYLDNLFDRLKAAADGTTGGYNEKIARDACKTMFCPTITDQESEDAWSVQPGQAVPKNVFLIKSFLKMYTGSFKNKLSDASAKKALAELMKSDKCGINISDIEIKVLPLYKFLATWNTNDQMKRVRSPGATIILYLVKTKNIPPLDAANLLTPSNIDTVNSIVEQQRINIVRDTVAACNTDITDTVRQLSIKVRQLLHLQTSNAIQIDDDKIDIELLDIITKNNKEYITKLAVATESMTEMDICTPLQRQLFNLGADHYYKGRMTSSQQRLELKCKCTKCGKTDVYSKFPIKTINYSKLWMSSYEVKDDDETQALFTPPAPLGWSVNPVLVGGKKKWRLETYMALLLANRVLMSGSNVIDMKTSGYAKCVRENNIGFISGANFICNELLCTQRAGGKMQGKELWLHCKDEIDAGTDAKYSIKTWQQDSGYIFPTRCISYIKNGKPTNLAYEDSKGIIFLDANLNANKNTIKKNNVDIAIMLNFYCKIVETVSSAVQFDQAGTSTDELKRKNMVLFYFFNGYTKKSNNKMLKDDYTGVLSGIDGFGNPSNPIMGWWETTLYTKIPTSLSTVIDKQTKIPVGPKLNDDTNLEIAGWITQLRDPYSVMKWYKSTPDISPPYGVAVLVKNAASLIKTRLKIYKTSLGDRMNQLTIILNILAISINTKLMGDWSQQEINKYLVGCVRKSSTDYYKINDALWSYIITVDGLLSQSAFLCGVRSHIARPPGAQIHEYRIGNTRSGHEVNKPIVFLLNAINDVTTTAAPQAKAIELEKYCVKLTFPNNGNSPAVYLDLKDIVKKYNKILTGIYINKLTLLDRGPQDAQPPPVAATTGGLIIEFVEGERWPHTTQIHNDMALDELTKNIKTEYEKETVKVYIETDRNLFCNIDDDDLYNKMRTNLYNKMGTKLYDPQGKSAIPDTNTFFKYSNFGDIYADIIRDDRGRTTFKELIAFIRKQKMANYKNNIKALFDKLKTKFDEWEKKFNAATVTDDPRAYKFYLSNSTTTATTGALPPMTVLMSDIEIETFTNILSEIHNYKSSIDQKSIDGEISNMLEHIGKAMFLFTNIHYITGVGLFNASMKMTPRSDPRCKGWFKKVAGEVKTNENIYIKQKSDSRPPAICRDMAPEIPVIVHPMYYPIVMDLDEFKKLPEAQIQQLKLLPKNIMRGNAVKHWTGASNMLLGTDEGLALYNGKHSIYFDVQKSKASSPTETIFYNLLFSENMSSSYNLSSDEDAFQGGYVDVLMESFYLFPIVSPPLQKSFAEGVLKKIKENWCYMFSLANLLDKFFDNVDEVVNLVVNEPTAYCTLSSNCPDTVGLIEPLVDSLDETQYKQKQLKGLASMRDGCQCWNVEENGKEIIVTPASGSAPHPTHSNFLTYKNLNHPSIFGNPNGSEEQLTQLEVTASNVLEIMGPLINGGDGDNDSEPKVDVKNILKFCGIFKKDGGLKYSVDLKQYKQQFEFYQPISSRPRKKYRSALYSRLQLKLLRSYLYYNKYLHTKPPLALDDYTTQILNFITKSKIQIPINSTVTQDNIGDVWTAATKAGADFHIFNYFLNEVTALITKFTSENFKDKEHFNGNTLEYDGGGSQDAVDFLNLHFRLYELFGTLLHSEIKEIVVTIKAEIVAGKKGVDQIRESPTARGVIIKYLLI